MPALTPGADGPDDSATSPPGEEGTSGLTIAGAVIGAVGVAATTVGIILGVTVLGDASDAESDPTLCPNEVCSPAGRDAIDSAETKALVSDVLIGVGAAATVGGLIMVLVGTSGDDASSDDTKTSSRLQVLPAVGPNGASAVVTISF